jgi:protein ImuB
MQDWHAADQGATKSEAEKSINTGISGHYGCENGALYPAWLLAQPQRLRLQDGQPQYHGALEILAGPQRLETGWLDGPAHCALRDYFVARSAVAGLLWIYRERLRPEWYLHGLFG